MLCNIPSQSQQKHRIKHSSQQHTTHTKSKKTERPNSKLSEKKQKESSFRQTRE